MVELVVKQNRFYDLRILVNLVKLSKQPVFVMWVGQVRDLEVVAQASGP